MVHHSPSLPVEIVALVFEHIGDAPTLLGCLVLSRSLQRYAEQALYADISFVLSLSHTSVPQLRSHAYEKDDSDTRRWSRGRIHGALALSGFRSAITQKPRLKKLTTYLTMHVLSPFGRFTPFYLDLNEILPTLTNLKYLDMRCEGADFPALAIAHTAPTSLTTLVLRDVGVPWGFIRRQRALEDLEVSGRMLDSAEEFSAEDQGDPNLWHANLKSLHLLYPRTPQSTSTIPSSPSRQQVQGKAACTPARLGLDEAKWEAARDSISGGDVDSRHGPAGIGISGSSSGSGEGGVAPVKMMAPRMGAGRGISGQPPSGRRAKEPPQSARIVVKSRGLVTLRIYGCGDIPKERHWVLIDNCDED
ncbi:hypothetical protein BDN71DRAFT_1433648 [Pleurotus eryngii]|uniref:F-box domain-containing protein n=1 Tax=Pleurotus eryngii TaxID=5323 RepID=A0A9P5ZU57_PLEER|nr:hypothetical protein BDN71DRAFT_1433648 [Pleurotus eryngii]